MARKPKPVERTLPRWSVAQGFSRWTGYAPTKEAAEAQAERAGFPKAHAFRIGPEL